MSNELLTFDTTRFVHDHCLCFAVQRAARALASRFDEALRPAGLTNQQFSLLMSLNRPEPPALGAVAAVLGMDRTTLTANLKPLEARGLVRTEVDARDRRSRRLLLTEAGRGRLEEALPIWRQAHEKLEALLVPGEADDMRAGLRVLS